MSLFEAAVSNAVVATIPALLAIVIVRVWQKAHPALIRALWLLVLIKLVTPPLAPLPCWTISADEARAEPGPQHLTVAPSSFESRETLLRPLELSLHRLSAERCELSSLTTDADEAGSDAASTELSSTNDTAAATTPVARNRQPARLPRTLAIPATMLTPQQWFRVTVWLWLAGSLIYLAWTAIRIWRFGRVFRLAKAAEPATQRRVRRLAARMGLRNVPAVCTLPGIPTPMIWAPWRTYLLIPEALLKEIDQRQLKALLAHELAHLRSGDHWVRRAEILIGALYWWHPVVGLARRRIREAEEQICDAWVVWTLPGISQTYATTLVDVISLLSEPKLSLPPTATGLSYFRSIQRRITMIMQGATTPRLSWTGWFAVLTMAALIIPVAPTLSKAAPQDEDSPQVEVTLQQLDDQIEATLVAATEQEEIDENEADEIEVTLIAFEAADEQERDDEEYDEDDEEEYDEDEEEGEDEEDEQEEAAEAVEEMIEEIQEAIEEMDEEVREAIEEAHEELEELVEEAPEEIQREMLEVDVVAIVGDAVRDAPKPVKMFVKQVNPAGVIERQLAKVDVELGEIESDETTRKHVRRRLEHFLREHIGELSQHTQQEIRNIRREIQRETSRSPQRVQEILEGVRFDEIIQDATVDTSPIVQQIVKEINVPEMVKQGLARGGDRDVERYRRERRERVDRDRARDREDRDRRARDDDRARDWEDRGRRARDDDRARDREDRDRRARDDDRAREADERQYEQLERRLERLLREAELIRREMERLKDRDGRRGAR